MMIMQIGLRFVVFAVVLGAGCGKKDEGTDRRAVAEYVMRKLANEAYPQWAMKPSNSGRCPTLVDLNEYMNAKVAKDPWGQVYIVKCGGDLPAGAAGIAIVSMGGDQKEGTGDDVKSWE